MCVRENNSATLLMSFYVQVELVSKVATVLLQTHYNQLVSTPSARPILSTLKEHLHKKVKVRIYLFGTTDKSGKKKSVYQQSHVLGLKSKIMLMFKVVELP